MRAGIAPAAVELGKEASPRVRLAGLQQESEYDLRATLDQLVADKAVLEKNLQAAQSLQSACKAWLERLPEGTPLEPLTVQINGHDLEGIRSRIEAAQGERTHLRSLPTPSADIEERVRHYVQSLAGPTITGLGKGEKLKVIFPGAGFDSNGPREGRAEVLPLIAMLFPTEMTVALMREIEHMTSGVIPIKERGSRIAALTAELEQLSYVEEVLVAAALANGRDVQRSQASPQAVLGVRIAETKATRRMSGTSATPSSLRRNDPPGRRSTRQVTGQRETTAESPRPVTQPARWAPCLGGSNVRRW